MKRHTREQRNQAIMLATQVGAAEAARQLGIPAATMRTWMHRGVPIGPVASDVTPDEQLAKAWADRRLELGERLGQIAAMAAENLARRLELGEVNDRNLVAVINTAINAAQLLTGGVTSRAEIVERTPEVEAELAQVFELLPRAS
jgi:transposase-like protein